MTARANGKGVRLTWPWVRFLSAHLVTSTGDQIATLVIALLAFQLTGSPMAVAIAFGLGYLGSVVGFLMVPALTGRSPRGVLVATDIVAALLVLTLLPVWMPLAAVSLFFLGALRAINRPYSQAMIARLAVSDPGRAKLSADYQTALTISLGFGLAAGALLVSLDVPQVGLALNALSFAGAAWLNSGLPVKIETQSQMVISHAAKRWSGLAGSEMRRQLRDPILSSLLLWQLLVFGPLIAYNSQLVSLAAAVSSSGLAYVAIEAASILGIVSAALIVRRGRFVSSEAQRWLYPIYIVASTCIGLGYSAGAVAESVAIIGLFLAIAGAADSVSEIFQLRLMHQKTDDQTRENVYALRFVLGGTSRTVAAFALGYVAEAWGIRPALFGTGVLMAIFSGGLWFFGRFERPAGVAV